MLTQQVPLCHSLTLFACSANLPIQAPTQEIAPVPMTISTTEQDENAVATSGITVPMDIDIAVPPVFVSVAAKQDSSIGMIPNTTMVMTVAGPTEPTSDLDVSVSSLSISSAPLISSFSPSTSQDPVDEAASELPTLASAADRKRIVSTAQESEKKVRKWNPGKKNSAEYVS